MNRVRFPRFLQSPALVSYLVSFLLVSLRFPLSDYCTYWSLWPGKQSLHTNGQDNSIYGWTAIRNLIFQLSWQMKWSINRHKISTVPKPKLGNMTWVAYTVYTRFGLTCYGRPGTCYAVGLELSRVLWSCQEGSLLCSHLDDVMDSHARKHQSNYHTALMIVLRWWKRSPGQGAKDECVNDKFISNKMLLTVIATERESSCFWLLHNALPWWLIRSSN